MQKKLNPNIGYQQGDFLNLPYNNEYFDGVWVHASIIHVQSLNEFEIAISEISRVLKVGGHAHFLLIPKLPNDTKISYFKKGFFDSAKAEKERVFYRTTKEEINELLGKYNLEAITFEIFEEGVRYPGRRMGIWWMWIVATKNVTLSS